MVSFYEDELLALGYDGNAPALDAALAPAQQVLAHIADNKPVADGFIELKKPISGASSLAK